MPEKLPADTPNDLIDYFNNHIAQNSKILIVSFFIFLLLFFVLGTLRTILPKEHKLINFISYSWAIATLLLIFLIIGITSNNEYTARERVKTPELPEAKNQIEKYIKEDNDFKKNPNARLKKDSIFNIIQSIIAEDVNKRKIAFDIGILNQNFFWKKGKIEIQGKENIYGIPDPKSIFKSESTLNRIRSSVGIICIGNSSYEEELLSDPYERRANEENRANERARYLASSVYDISDTIPIYTLNIGKCKIIDSKESNNERGIVIIYLKACEKGVDIKNALFRSLIHIGDMPFRIINYTKGENEEYLELVPYTSTLQ